MSEVEARFVKRGFWINLERGPIMGKTLTVNIQTGTILVALLAVLISLAMTHLWHLLAFAHHQSRAKGHPGDGLFQQQQVLLRTLAQPSAFAADWMKLWWLWRRRGNHAFKRSIAQLLVATAFTAATIAVGVFSSYIASSTNLQVLVKSPHCGPLDVDPTPGELQQKLSRLRNYRADLISRSGPFAEECYRNTTSLPVRCKAFISPNIALAPKRVQCPFDTKICAAKEYGVSVDSGLIDGNDVFGWNLKDTERVKYRRKATCGILGFEGRTGVINASDYSLLTRDPYPGEKLFVLNYGSLIASGEFSNFTFLTSSVTAGLSNRFSTSLSRNFLNPEWRENSDINVLPEMASNDSDLVLVHIASNQVAYTTPVNDPFFSAHKPFSYRTTIGTDITAYKHDWLNRTMGCRQQYQYCVARANAPELCTDLNALPGTIHKDKFPGASEVQLAALRLLVTSGLLFDTSDAVENGIEASKLFGGGGFIASLPDDQWIREVVGWERYIWASMQTIISDYAVGHAARDPSVLDSIKKNTTQGERQLCGLQRMRKSGGFMNINVFGLAFIITFSVIVTVLDLVLLKFLIFLRRFRRALAPRLDRWIQDGVFQLQRRAYEAKDGVPWEFLQKEIPFPANNDLLDELPIETSPNLCKHRCLTCNSSSMSDQVQGTAHQSQESVEQPQGFVSGAPQTTAEPQPGVDDHQQTLEHYQNGMEELHESTYEHEEVAESCSPSSV